MEFVEKLFLWACPFIDVLFHLVAIFIGAYIGVWVVRILLAKDEGDL